MCVYVFNILQTRRLYLCILCMFACTHMHVHVCTYLYVITINKKEGMNLKENKKRSLNRFGGRKGEGEVR